MGLIKMHAAYITYKLNGPGTEEPGGGYVARPVRYSTIDVADLADHISADSRVERSKVAVITDSLIKQIREMVLNGHTIEVPHLGTFKPKIKSQLAANEAMIDASSFSAKVLFRPSVELKRNLQATRIEKINNEKPVSPLTPEEEKQNWSNSTSSFAEKWAKKYFPGGVSYKGDKTTKIETDSVPRVDAGLGSVKLVGFLVTCDVYMPGTVADTKQTFCYFKAKNPANGKYMVYSYAGGQATFYDDSAINFDSVATPWPTLFYKVEYILPPDENP